MNEASRIERWIYQALTTDSALAGVVSTRVFADQAPEDAVYPFVVYNLQDGLDVNGVGTCRLLVKALYQVKVIAQEKHDTNTRLVADRIDEVIGKARRAQHPSDNSFQFNGRRERLISYTEPEGESSNRFRHLGGLYWITASAA